MKVLPVFLVLLSLSACGKSQAELTSEQEMQRIAARQQRMMDAAKRYEPQPSASASSDTKAATGRRD